jgi:hypothetical protein
MDAQASDSTEGTPLPGRFGRLRARLESVGLNRRLAEAAIAPLVGALATLWLVIPTLAPGLLSQAGGDSAEFQTVAWVLGTAHPTGYPAYVILGFIATHLVPFGDPAFRLNLLQAFLGAGAVAGTVAIVNFMTGLRWVALATGLLLLIMPTFSAVSPAGMSFQSSPVFWRLSTYADPHLFHLALVTLIFMLLLVWGRRRTDPETRGRSDRWLIGAAAVYGMALANHSLTLMLAPGIGLYVLAVAPRIVLQWRLIIVSAVALAATAVAFWLELPIRAAMHAPLVYAHPDTWSGFMYVITGQQFGGIPPTIWDDLSTKYASVMSLMAGWLGPLGYVAAVGLGTSLIRRPRYLLLCVPAAVMTSAFAAAYANSDLERYFLVPVFVAYTLVGFGLADGLSLLAWIVGLGRDTASASATDDAQPADEQPVADEGPRDAWDWNRPALRAAEIVAVVVLIAACVTVVPTRQQAPGQQPGGVSAAYQVYRETWVRAVLASPDKGGLPANAVIVGNWYDSTSLWYGQKVEGLRPDVFLVDDTMRVAAGDNLGQVWEVIDSYLGRRPVFLLRFPWNCDGMDNLRKFYSMSDFPLSDGSSIPQVTGKLGPVVCQ